MIWAKLAFGGLGRRGLEAAVAAVVLSILVALVAASLMVIGGARETLRQTERIDRPDILQVKSRFNRALFETPRSGHLPALTLPVYEPLIDPGPLAAAVGDATVVARQSLLRNVVSGDSFLNIYIFGIQPEAESQVSTFSLARGRFLHSGDTASAVLDTASAQALGIDVGGTFPVRKADGEDLPLTVVGILNRVDLRGGPPRTIEAPALTPKSATVSNGAFVTLRTSEAIFGREALTDALVVAREASGVPALVTDIREAFRLETGVFVRESYSRFQRKVHDFALTLALFTVVSAATAVFAGSFVASLLHDVYAERRRQYAVLIALGFPPITSIAPGLAIGTAIVVVGMIAGNLAAIGMVPQEFAMPSLMADLGAVEPQMSLAIAGITIAIAASAVILGITPTAWQLGRKSAAALLSDGDR
jgi:MacB-like protein